MGTRPPAQIPFPLSSFPGANPQEGAGRLINCSAEPLGEGSHQSAPSAQVWRRQPGFSRHNLTATGQTGYRGGLIVNNLSYEAWNGNASTLDIAGNYVSLGAFPGSKKISIARNQNGAGADIIAVDLDNGAYKLSGGGAPTAYNGGGNLPQPNSVCFQDGYFFFTIADGRCFASGINALTQNSQTFTTANAKADVTLLRGIAFSGLLWLFSTGHCEVYQDTAQAFPAFPYSRQIVLEYGLVQSNAIAGFEVGFSELVWVAQDYGVYWATPGSLQPQKISPPDLDRLIEAEVKAGNTLEASCYAFGGKKFWVLSSPDWSWEFNFATKKWNERQSLGVNGLQGRWRFTGGHPAFQKWLGGDQQTGNLMFIDDARFDEDGAPQLFRIESGPVRDFPNQIRIARADFDFVLGVGQAVGNFQMTVLGAAAGNGGVVRLTVNDATPLSSIRDDRINVSGVGGTIEANGSWHAVKIDDRHIDLIGTVFVNAYTAGGIAIDVTSPAPAPVCAISTSLDGGITYDVPSIRSLSVQQRTKRARVSVKNRGLSSALGNRWRIDVTDPVYTGLLGGTQSSNPREIGP
ncbi:MAG TPA: hypothetical protein VFV12_08770 [Xanthobacteraceae bacterium]|nr:hypothetical protein [Xanthobacteraceae bacterium]